MKSEVAILSQISHPHILKLHNVVSTNETVVLVLEYVYGDPLNKFLGRHGGKFGEDVAKPFF